MLQALPRKPFGGVRVRELAEVLYMSTVIPPVMLLIRAQCDLHLMPLSW